MACGAAGMRRRRDRVADRDDRILVIDDHRPEPFRGPGRCSSSRVSVSRSR